MILILNHLQSFNFSIQLLNLILKLLTSSDVDQQSFLNFKRFLDLFFPYHTVTIYFSLHYSSDLFLFSFYFVDQLFLLLFHLINYDFHCLDFSLQSFVHDESVVLHVSNFKQIDVFLLHFFLECMESDSSVLELE